MSIFVVTSTRENEELSNAIRRRFPNDHYEITPTQWLVSANSTAQKLNDDLEGVTETKFGGVLIVNISSYYGRHSTALWEWIKTKWENGPHG